MTGVNNHWQVCALAQDRHGGKIKCVARRRFKCANAAFAKDDTLVAFGHDVLGRSQPFVHRSHQTTLQQNRQSRLSDYFQEREILHVPCADLQDVNFTGDRVDISRTKDLGNSGQAVSFCRVMQQRQCFETKSLKIVTRSTWFKAATAEHSTTGFPNSVRTRSDLLARLDRTGSSNQCKGCVAAETDAAYFDARILHPMCARCQAVCFAFLGNRYDRFGFWLRRCDICLRYRSCDLPLLD